MTSLNNRRDSEWMGDDIDEVVGDSTLTSAATTSVLNMGDTPRIHTSTRTEGDSTTRSLPQTRHPRQYLPSHKRVKELLCKAVIPSERAAFRDRFDREMGPDALKTAENHVCNTPLRWVREAFGMQEDPQKLREMADMFPSHGSESEFLDEFYIMDVILNRRVLPSRRGKKAKSRTKRDGEDDCDGESSDSDSDSDDNVDVDDDLDNSDDDCRVCLAACADSNDGDPALSPPRK